MANILISDLPIATVLSLTDRIPIVPNYNTSTYTGDPDVNSVDMTITIDKLIDWIALTYQIERV